MNQETTEKISRTKIETTQRKILEGIIKNDIPTQSSIQLAIPTHRTKKRLSFDEYKQLIIQGKSVEQLKKEYAKHLVAFYTALAKGRINLSKEKFEENYIQGVSLDEIARANNIPREHITYLREYYGIKRKGATYQRRLSSEVPLSQEAKDVIIGSLLGDGHITPAGYFSEKHSEKQVEYLEWKASFLKPILTDKSFSDGEYFDKRYGSTNFCFCLRTITHTFLYEMREKFYEKENDKWAKVIPIDMENMMNERVLAIWFMDDGHTSWMHKTKIEHPNWNVGIQCKLSTESFTYNDNILLQSILKKKWDLNTTVRPKGIKNFLLKFDTISSKKLINIITPYISTSDMFYKINYSKFIEKCNIKIDKKLAMENFDLKHNIIKN